MLRTTLRQMASISGRAIIVAIGLASASVLALAPSAKAEDLIITNPSFRNINGYTIETVVPAPSSGGISAVVGKLNVSANDVFVIKVSGTGVLTGSNGGSVPYTLKIGTTGTEAAPSATATVFYTGTASEALTNKDLDFTVASSANFQEQLAGSYQDTVTLTISAN